MSGPIVRKYGFPNFEKIFGERELKHGTGEDTSKAPNSQAPFEPAKVSEASEPNKPDDGLSKS